MRANRPGFASRIAAMVASGHEGLYEVLLKDVTHYRRFAISVRRNSEPVRTREATWDEVEEAGSRGLERQGAKERYGRAIACGTEMRHPRISRSRGGRAAARALRSIR